MNIPTTDILIEYCNQIGQAYDSESTAPDAVPSPPNSDPAWVFFSHLTVKDAFLFFHEDTRIGHIWHHRDSGWLIVLRGTTSAIEWLEDFQIVPVSWTIGDGPSDNIEVELGFASVLSKIMVDNVHVSLSTWIKGYAAGQITLTGHSLGAAVAVLGATLVKGGRAHVFACPRVGNASFVTAFGTWGTEVYAVKNTPDLVPDNPIDYSAFSGSLDETTLMVDSRTIPWIADTPLGWHILETYRQCLLAKKTEELRLNATPKSEAPGT